MAWLSGWNRRKQLYINSTNSATQSNFQMKITINYGSGTDGTPANNIYCGGICNTDFSDIRFNSTDGITPLYYWIQSYSSSSSATVWVKIPSIPTGSNSTYIYFYYNNPNATTTSDITNTFIYGDGFDSTSLSAIWTWEPGYSGSSYSLTTNSGWLRITMAAHSGYYWCAPYSRVTVNNSSLGNSMIIETKINFNPPSPGSNQGALAGITSVQYQTGGPGGDIKSAPGNDYNYGSTNFYAFHQYNVFNCPTNGSRSGVSTSPGIIYLRQIWNNLTLSTYFSKDGVNYTGVSSTTISQKYFPGICLINFDAVNVSCDFDYFFIRQYASPEPTWSSSVNTEQSVTLNISSNPSGGEIWLNTPSGTSNWSNQHVSTPSILNVTPGTSYDVMVGVGGYQQWFLTDVCTGNCVAGSVWNIVANPILLPGSLAIYSTPTGASIYLDGSNTSSGTTVSGGTTLTNISVGSHPIRLSLTGYIDWSGTTTINTQSTTIVNSVFAGSANISSTPTGASIYLDSSPTSIGATPRIITNLTPSTNDGTQPTQSHTYILTKSGYADTSGSFTATAGQTLNIPVTFPGSLYITSIPIGAQIYIDNILQP